MGSAKPPIHHDLFVALTGYSSISCTSAELISASPDKSSIHIKYHLSSDSRLRFLACLADFTRCLMAMAFYQPFGVIYFHPSANNVTSMLDITKMFNPQAFRFEGLVTSLTIELGPSRGTPKVGECPFFPETDSVQKGGL